MNAKPVRAPNRKWTQEELDFIKENYLIMTYREMALKLGRNPAVIGKAISNLKLKRPAKYKNIELGDIFGRLVVKSRDGSDKSGSAMWLCVCECGKETRVLGYSLKRGHTKSCGCFNLDNVSDNNRKPPGVASYNIRFGLCKDNASERSNMEFNLDIDQWKNIVKNDCIYCGLKPPFWSPYIRIDGLPRKTRHYTVNQKTISNSIIYLNGVDRIDSSKGYSLDNCVPACNSCNTAKLDYTVGEFVQQTKARFLALEGLEERIANFLKK